MQPLIIALSIARNKAQPPFLCWPNWFPSSCSAAPDLSFRFRDNFFHGLAIHSVQDVDSPETKEAPSPLPFLADDDSIPLWFFDFFGVVFPVFPISCRHLGSGGRCRWRGRRERERRQRSLESPSEGRTKRMAAPLRVNRATKRVPVTALCPMSPIWNQMPLQLSLRLLACSASHYLGELGEKLLIGFLQKEPKSSNDVTDLHCTNPKRLLLSCMMHG